MKYLRLMKDLPGNKAYEIRTVSNWYGYGRERHFPEDWVESKIWFKEVSRIEYETQEIIERLKKYEQILLEDK